MSYMKESKKSTTPDASAPSAPSGGKTTYTLPGESEPSEVFLDYNWCIHGEKGVGKSTLCQQFTDLVVHCHLEPGRSVDMRGTIIPKKSDGKPTWFMMQQYFKLVIKNKKPGRINIDTIDQLARLCESHWCAVKGVKSLNGINDHGRAWSELKDDWYNTFNDLFYNGWRVNFLSHSRYRPKNIKGIPREEMKQAIEDGLVESEVQPSCSGWAYDYLKVPCSFAGYYGYIGRQHVLYIRGHDAIYAATARDDRFLQPKKADDRPGQPYDAIPMGNSAKEAYRNLLLAWDNKLEGIFTTDEEEAE